jgi:hypothetical protein
MSFLGVLAPECGAHHSPLIPKLKNFEFSSTYLVRLYGTEFRNTDFTFLSVIFTATRAALPATVVGRVDTGITISHRSRTTNVFILLCLEPLQRIHPVAKDSSL